MIDLKNRPVGATHHYQNVFYKIVGEVWYLHCKVGWIPSSLDSGILQTMLTTLPQSQPEWSSKITTNEYNGGSVRSLVGQMFDDVNGIK